MPELTVTRLKEILDYSPKTGVFTWKVSRGPGRAGSMAGSLHHKGYRGVTLFNGWYLAHRLAWFYMKGHWPKDEIDHINGKRDDNRLVNLRVVTKTVNQRNAKRRCDNSSKITGVCWYKRYSRSRVQIGVDGKVKHVGYFTNKRDAIKARREADRKHGYHENHGRR